MVFNWRPTLMLLGLLATLAWIASLFPGGASVATAEPALGAPRPANGFVALREEAETEERKFGDDREEDYDDEDYDEKEDGGKDGDDDDGEEWDEADWNEEREQVEVELTYLELKRAELQALFGELELVEQITEIVSDADKTAALAIMSVVEEVDGGEQQIAFLQDMMSVAKSEAIRRLIRLQLAEAYSEVNDVQQALSQVRALVSGE